MRRDLEPATLLKRAEDFCTEQRTAFAVFRTDTAKKLNAALGAALQNAVLVPVAEDREKGLASFFAAQRDEDLRRFLALDAGARAGSKTKEKVVAAAKAFIAAETERVAACVDSGTKVF